MPKPFRGQISGSSPTGMLIRASKDVWCRGLYRRLGPEEFYRRRLAWLLAHGKTTSYNRLVAYLAESFTGRMGTTLGDQWVPPERLRRGLFDHSRDQGSSPAGLATTS